jgi:hypothetical protein
MERKKRCFSTCKRRPKTECNTSLCQYNDGLRRKYCRLKHTYKMNADCEPELRTYKGTRRKAIPKRVQSELNRMAKIESQIIAMDDAAQPSSTRKKTQSPPKISSQPKVTEEEIKEFRERVKKANATRKIKKFMRKHQNKRRARFLKAICSDAGVCMAFGKESKTIKKHFDEFGDLNLLSKPAKTIGSVSANGFVKELTFERNGYVANAVLKSSTSVDSDNLFYEGLVGQALNEYGQLYPCFLETYGTYKYNSTHVYNEMKNNKLTNKNVLPHAIKKISDGEMIDFVNELGTACEDPTKIAVMIQHLKDVETLGDSMRNPALGSMFVSRELLYVLYQIYMPLATLRHNFTHYDLHTNNVLLYEPVKGSYIQYHYHITDDMGTRIVKFKSRYIAKIIDYGRCYFKIVDPDPSNEADSKAIYDEVICKEPKCKDCGYNRGFGWLKHTPYMLKYRSYICSQKPNISHDLRLLYIIKKNADITSSIPTYWYGDSNLLLDLLKKIQYGVNVELNADKKLIQKTNPNAPVYSGTEENTTSGFPASINNVVDACIGLEQIISGTVCQYNNDWQYSSYTKLGDLHIYNDGKTIMEYIPV